MIDSGGLRDVKQKVKRPVISDKPDALSLFHVPLSRAGHLRDSKKCKTCASAFPSKSGEWYVPDYTSPDFFSLHSFRPAEPFPAIKPSTPPLRPVHFFFPSARSLKETANFIRSFLFSPRRQTAATTHECRDRPLAHIFPSSVNGRIGCSPLHARVADHSLFFLVTARFRSMACYPSKQAIYLRWFYTPFLAPP